MVIPLLANQDLTPMLGGYRLADPAISEVDLYKIWERLKFYVLLY